MVRPGRSSLYAIDAGTSNLDPVSDLTHLFLSTNMDSSSTPTTSGAQPILSSNPTVSDAQVAQGLVQRLSKDQAYTRIGARSVISMRPTRTLAKFSDSASKEYAEAAKSTDSKSLSSKDPHIFDIAASAYFHMTRGTDDQSIVLFGESGSGKSETTRMLVRNLCDLSKTTKKKTKVASNILKVDPVLSAFGNASTPYNSNASGFIRYTELQFGQGRMVGMKLINHLLEKSRVSGPTDGGLTFHIFYYLLEGASHEERVQWHLSDAAHFNYLSAKNRVVGYAQGKGATALEEIRTNLKALGIGRRQQVELWRLLAAILHLGNITFQNGARSGDPCSVRNYPQLTLVAEMLGVSADSLQSVLTYRTKHVGTESMSVFLSADAAVRQRDYLARCLYSVAFEWIVEQINSRLCESDSSFDRCLSILEVPGFAGTLTAANGYHRLLLNYANEKVFSFICDELFEVPKAAFASQGLPYDISYNNNADVIDLCGGLKNGLISIIGMETIRSSNDENMAAKIYESNKDTSTLVMARSNKQKYAFGVQHYGGIVEYDTRGFSELDSDLLQSDFVTLIRGSPEQPGTVNVFLRAIFSDKLISTRTSARDGNTVVSASNRTRFPSMKRRRSKITDDEEEVLDASNTVGHQFRYAITDLLDTVSQTQSWFIFHIRGTDGSNLAKIEREVVERQVATMQLVKFAQNPACLYTFALPHADFVERYKSVAPLYYENAKSACESLYRYQRWSPTDCLIGKGNIFLSEKAWRTLENMLIAKELEEERQQQEAEAAVRAAERSQNNQGPLYSAQGAGGSVYGSEAGGDGEGSVYESETGSHYGSEFNVPPLRESSMTLNNESHVQSRDIESGMGTTTRSAMLAASAEMKAKGQVSKPPPQKEPERPMTKVRKGWLCFSWGVTFCCLPGCLSSCGKMRDRARQIAWREKVALCTIIFLMNAFILFFIVGLSYVLCRRERALSPGEITTKTKESYVYMYGNYYKIPDIVVQHNSKYMADTQNTVRWWEDSVLGRDVSQMFDKSTSWSRYCRRAQPAGFRLFDDPPRDYYNHRTSTLETLNRYIRGTVVWDAATRQERIEKMNKRIVSAYGRIYDVTSLYDTALNPSQGTTPFLGQLWRNITEVDSRSGSSDSTRLFEVLKRGDLNQWTVVMECMEGLFYVGRVDTRNDLRCVIPNYILLAASAILVAVIGFKFLAALQFPGRRQPEEHDKFVICQVPCYTEGEASLLRTINSLANLNYDDKHKLMFIICDGMIIGSGNDRPTPRIVLDILGVDPAYEPETLAYKSLGEGNQQLNMAKVYSGLYEINGHVVPYIVVVKVGKASERTKPGNRGKRDSQLILMQFLSRVHFNQAMSPLELELFHQMKNVIGVDPAFYEFVFMVDADTIVHEDSLNYLVSHMVRDNRIAGTCGETNIANERKSFTSMIQVYEYFISHHLSKAFESLFGSVTCLPGCFCMYRIRSRNIPVLVAPGVLEDYSENNVNTLHLKNLLHLGEDRYLTTLILKHFPSMKTTFTQDAKCKTYAPEKWAVLLSQRRRWINSTVHNLFELMLLSELCGFCCFSMRFVVFIDLLATFIQPSALLYIIYLVYSAFQEEESAFGFPTISLIMIAAVYGFQIIIFLLRTEWQHIGWMIIYMLAIPLFGFYIPLYSFWHFDDFSWGNTRLVVERKNKDGLPVATPAPEQEYFDPASVPLVKWVDYEAARRQIEVGDDTSSFHSGYTGKSGRTAGTGYTESNYHGTAPSVGGSAFAGPSPAYFHPAAAPGASSAGYPSLGRSIISLGDNKRASYISIGSGYGGAMPPVPPVPIAGPAVPPVANAFPTDDEILMEIKHILSTTDLMKVTKKSIREQLSRFFGVDMTPKKEYIHRCIDSVLRGEL